MTNDEHRNWQKQRQQGIGGSDVAAIMGCSPWMSEHELYRSKTVPVDELEESDDKKEFFYWRHALEPLVINRFVSNRPEIVERSGLVLTSQRYVDPIYPYIYGNIDALVRMNDGRKILVDAKTSISFKAKQWEFVPGYVQCQMAHYARLVDPDEVWIALLIGGTEYRELKIERDRDYENLILERCTAWWEKHIIGNSPPELDPLQAADRCFIDAAANDGTAVDLGPDEQDAHDEIEEINATVRPLNKRKDELKAQIKMAMGAAATGYLPGGGGYVREEKEYPEKLQPARVTRYFRYKKRL